MRDEDKKDIHIPIPSYEMKYVIGIGIGVFINMIGYVLLFSGIYGIITEEGGFGRVVLGIFIIGMNYFLFKMTVFYQWYSDSVETVRLKNKYHRIYFYPFIKFKEEFPYKFSFGNDR